MKYIAIVNNKARIKCVFDYMMAEELESPSLLQKEMLSEMCDYVSVINSMESIKQILKSLPGNTYLYYVNVDGSIKLTGITTHTPN